MFTGHYSLADHSNPLGSKRPSELVLESVVGLRRSNWSVFFGTLRASVSDLGIERGYNVVWNGGDLCANNGMLATSFDIRQNDENDQFVVNSGVIMNEGILK